MVNAVDGRMAVSLARLQTIKADLLQHIATKWLNSCLVSCLLSFPQSVMAFAGLLKEADITAALAACQGNSRLPGTDKTRIRGFIAEAVPESHKQSVCI